MSLLDTFVRRTRFLGEQDGAEERKLKAALMPLFPNLGVNRAYLVRLKYGLFSSGVALCLQTMQGAAPEERIVQEIDSVFSRVFPGHLDIMFLNDSRERDVAAVCPPFFVLQRS